MNNLFINIFWAIIGAIVGMTAADIDLAPVFHLKHRSAWTHGPLVPALALLLVQAYPGTWAFVAAFMGTYALHMLLDMFPHTWKGSALINLAPLPLNLSPLLSFLYLLAGMVAAVLVGSRIMGWPLVEILQRWI